MTTQFIQNRVKTPLITLLAVFCLNSSIGNANESTYKPFIKGSFEQIQQENKDRPYIIAFWSITCAYCMKELGLFGELMEKYPQIKLITISTDAFFEDESVDRLLETKSLTGTETWIFANNHVEKLYFDINPNWRGELPLTYFFDQEGSMIKHMGVVNEGELVAWLNEQVN